MQREHAELSQRLTALDAERTINGVVTAIRRELPGAFVVGVDDGSTDGTRTMRRRS